MSKTFVYVGNWSFQANPEKGKGISIFEYEQTNGDLKLIETICPEVAAGYITLNEANGMLYSNDERGERHGEIGGGGYLLAFRINRSTGKIGRAHV